MKRVLIAVLILFAVAVTAGAVTVSTGSLELTVYENNGRFSINAIDTSGAKTALLVDEDPRTTVLTVLAGSKIYRMGDSFEFRQSIENDDESITITWSNASLTVKEVFAVNGRALSITLSVENTSEQDLEIGMRYLLDTKLGEKGVHFAADDLSVETETDYVWATPVELVTSDGKNMEMRLLLSGDDITDPDRVVVANWKRLNDASWTYESNGNRDFSLLPYSINDSAAALYFEPEVVPSSTVRTASYVIDWKLPGEVEVEVAESTPVIAVPETVGQSDVVDTIEDEVEKIDSVLVLLDKYLEMEDDPTEEEIKALKERLKILEKRKEELSEQP